MWFCYIIWTKWALRSTNCKFQVRLFIVVDYQCTQTVNLKGVRVCEDYQVALFMFTAIYLVPICLLFINVLALYMIHQSAHMTRVGVPLWREPLEGITFQYVHHKNSRRELWWDLLYSDIGLYFMKSPKYAFEKARPKSVYQDYWWFFFQGDHLKKLSHPPLYKVWCPSYLAARENVSTK